MVIAPDRIVDPARILIQSLMIVQREHLRLLVILILLVLLAMLIECILLLRVIARAFRSAVIILLLRLILLIKEGEVVGVLAFAFA